MYRVGTKGTVTRVSDIWYGIRYLVHMAGNILD